MRDSVSSGRDWAKVAWSARITTTKKKRQRTDRTPRRCRALHGHANTESIWSAVSPLPLFMNATAAGTRQPLTPTLSPSDWEREEHSRGSITLVFIFALGIVSG